MSAAPPATGRRPASRVVPAQPWLTQRARSRRRRRWRRLGILVLALTAIGALVWLVWFSSVLSIRQVEVEGVEGAEAATVKTLAAVPLGGPLARADTDAITQRVRARVSVAEANVSRSWPNTLTITVAPRVARIVVAGSDGGLHLADATGVLFENVDAAPANLPQVTVSTSGGADRPSVVAALSVVTTLPPDLAKQVRTIEVTSAHRVTFQLGEIRVVWGGKEQPERKVELLRALLATSPASIDVSVPDSPTTT